MPLDQPSFEEHLPTLYRLALDAADDLARRGRRAEAANLRMKAAKAYSQAWDERCRTVLENVIRRAHQASGTPPPTLPSAAESVAS